MSNALVVTLTDADAQRLGVATRLEVNLGELTMDDLIALDEQAGLSSRELAAGLEGGEVKARSLYWRAAKATTWLALRAAGTTVPYADLRLSPRTIIDALAVEPDGGEAGKDDGSETTSSTGPPS